MPKVSKSRKAKVEEPWSDVAGGSGGAVDKADANNGFNVNTTSTDDQPLNFTNVPSLPPVHAAATIGGGAKEEEDSKMPAAGSLPNDGGEVRSKIRCTVLFNMLNRMTLSPMRRVLY